MRVLSIDPGYERLGIAIIEKTNTPKDTLLYSDCFRTDTQDSFKDRLLQIGLEIERLIETYSPNVIAIEQLFFNTNQKTALSVTEVIGVITYIAKKENLLIFEYTPLQIKSAVSGYGKSTKEQVAKMIPHLIEIRKEIALDDEYDAIAVGLTCLASERLIF
ncbi:MAG: crossover junction endodeoxyribonuclease RuvC [Candidatus Paceibacterota bacterium]